MNKNKLREAVTLRKVDNLNKENFWDIAMQLCPRTVQHFCDYVDRYKKELYLIPSQEGMIQNGAAMANGFKFHDMPLAMQFGVILNFFGTVSWPTPNVPVNMGTLIAKEFWLDIICDLFMACEVGYQPVEQKIEKLLLDMQEGDKVRLLTDPADRIRRVCQKGKREAYCPYDGQNTMGHSMSSGDEVFPLSTPCISLMPKNCYSVRPGTGKTYVFVSIASTAQDYHIVDGKLNVLTSYGGFDRGLNQEVGDDTYDIQLPPGEYFILADTARMTEEMAATIVVRHHADKDGWKNYAAAEGAFHHAATSLSSLIASKDIGGRFLILEEGKQKATVVKPLIATLDEAVDHLLPRFAGMEQYLGKGVTEDKFASFCHSQLSGGIGMKIRNEFGFWTKDTELYRHMVDVHKLSEPDAMSDLIIRRVYQRLVQGVDMEQEPAKKMFDTGSLLQGRNIRG